MDLTTFLPQLGIGGIFVWIAYKLYNDMRQDSLRREQQILTDGKAREEKLIVHLDKVTDTLDNVKVTLKDFNVRLETIEDCVKCPKE